VKSGRLIWQTNPFRLSVTLHTVLFKTLWYFLTYNHILEKVTKICMSYQKLKYMHFTLLLDVLDLESGRHLILQNKTNKEALRLSLKYSYIYNFLVVLNIHPYIHIAEKSFLQNVYEITFQKSPKQVEFRQ